jgi:hypothetical protein
MLFMLCILCSYVYVCYVIMYMYVCYLPPVEAEAESFTPSIRRSKSGSFTILTPTCAAFNAPTSLVPSPHISVKRPGGGRVGGRGWGVLVCICMYVYVCMYVYIYMYMC